MPESAFQKTADQCAALKMLGGKARYTLLFGGSRSGKTFILVYALLVRALRAPGSRHIILRYRGNAVRQAVRLDTFEKVRRLAFPKLKLVENRSDQWIKLPNRSEIWFGGLDSEERVEKILGKEFATIYFNECSEIEYASVVIALTRLAQKTALVNRAYFDCNPPGKSHWSYKLFILKQDPASGERLKFPANYDSMLMNPAGNKANLPSGYLEETLAGLTEYQRRRFELGEWLEDRTGSLWTHRMIDSARVSAAPELVRIVIGVDPSVTGNSASDETGIVTAGIAPDGHFYVLDDSSLRGTPAEWAAKVAEIYRRFHADRVIGEVNNGGDLIESVLRQAEPALSYRAVRAMRGKLLRAEPVSALYERGFVHHAGHFPELEEQMTGYHAQSEKSPDRLDAMVWAVTELAEKWNCARSGFIL